MREGERNTQPGHLLVIALGLSRGLCCFGHQGAGPVEALVSRVLGLRLTGVQGLVSRDSCLNAGLTGLGLKQL